MTPSTQHRVATYDIFLPCAAGAKPFLAAEVTRVTGAAAHAQRAGVRLRGDWAAVMRLNLHSRMAQRVLVELAHAPYRSEDDIYQLAFSINWSDWFTPRETFRVDLSAQASPLRSLNFATLRVKDAVADHFRDRHGVRPSVATRGSDLRVFAHLSATHCTVSIDTSGEPLFKRGWREDKGDAPLKETLAAAILAAAEWDGSLPLYDPCCGSGTLVIEAAQIAAGIAPGSRRRFAFERLRGHRRDAWDAIKQEASQQERVPAKGLFGSDVAHRMVDFARRNAERAGVGPYIEWRGGDALERMPPGTEPGVLVLNPPYGERIGVLGATRSARQSVQLRRGPDEPPDASDGDDEAFFERLAAHWKRHYAGWTAWVLTPDTALPSKMRLKATRRVPLFNGPIECRLLKFSMVQGSAREPRGA